MKKLVLFFSMLLVSFHTFAAASHPVGSAILNSIQSKKAVISTQSNSSLIYGGKDISRSIIATANESLWAGQQTWIG